VRVNLASHFASAHLVHLALVAWLTHIGAAQPLGTFVIFVIAVLWTNLLVLFSITSQQQALGLWGWWTLRVVGLNDIAKAFALDFLRHPQFGSLKCLAGYLPLADLSTLRPPFWMAAFARVRAPRLRSSSSMLFRADDN
jgi:hypothetical protein